VVWMACSISQVGSILAQPARWLCFGHANTNWKRLASRRASFNIKDSEDLAGLWIGVGSFEAPPAPKPKASPAKSGHTYEVRDVDPDKPHFAHRPADEQNQDGTGASGGGTGSGTGTSAQNAPPVDPDRPTLHPRPSGGDSGSSSAGSSSSTTSHRTPTRIGQRFTAVQCIGRGGQRATGDRSESPASGYTAPVDQSKLDKPTALFGLPPDMNQMAGISDERPADTESWGSRGRIRTMRTR